jgi:hypothetical protein
MAKGDVKVKIITDLNDIDDDLYDLYDNFFEILANN